VYNIVPLGLLFFFSQRFLLIPLLPSVMYMKNGIDAFKFMFGFGSFFLVGGLLVVGERREWVL
jgi:hypothetical protein